MSTVRERRLDPLGVVAARAPDGRVVHAFVNARKCGNPDTAVTSRGRDAKEETALSRRARR